MRCFGLKQCPLLATLVAGVLAFNGCIIGYRQYPHNQLTSPYSDKSLSAATYYVKGMTLAGGNLAVERTLKDHSPFQSIEERSEIPPTGLHIFVKVDTISPSASAVAFGYLSYVTLTLLPCWSTRDGVDMEFNIYKDKQLVKTLDYKVLRSGGMWLGLLPFIWINLMTTSEETACEAATKQFLEDAKPYFSNP